MIKGAKTGFLKKKRSLSSPEVVHSSYTGQINIWIRLLRYVIFISSPGKERYA
jgi:hypothetical protein